MSGFEIVGVVLAVLPMLGGGLQFCQDRAIHLRKHDVAMDTLIGDLQVEHGRLHNSLMRLLDDVVERKSLCDLVEQATESKWKEAIDQDINMVIRERLGYGYQGYIRTLEKAINGFKQLDQVAGIQKNERWYMKITYHKPKWHRELQKSLSDFFNHGSHQRLLVTIRDSNTQLEQLLLYSGEKPSPPKLGIKETERLECIRLSAKSLYCALCSNWLCQCKGSHATHFQLRTSVTPLSHPHRFNLMFGLSGTRTDDEHWHEVELQVEEVDDTDGILLSNAIRTPGRVSFSSTANSRTPSPAPSNRIKDICAELKSSATRPEARCIGFLEEDDRRHFMHIPKRKSARPSAKHAISLQQLLSNDGEISSPVSLAIELADRYELAFLLASSLLQLHATSWLKESWSTEEIYFVPTQPDMTLGECVYVTRQFPPDSGLSESKTSTSLDDLRSMVVLNEAVFRLGATLVELSILATLGSQEIESDRKFPELADIRAARRISKKNMRKNVHQWNQVVEKCLYPFDARSDFSKKDFRQEFYRCVVAPLRKLAEDAKPE